MNTQDWRRVTRCQPCPVCGRPIGACSLATMTRLRRLSARGSRRPNGVEKPVVRCD